MTTRHWATWMIVWALCLMLGGIGATVVVAETRLTLGAGVTNFLITTPDGTWWQHDQPHGFDTLSLALKGGVEQTLGDHWYVGAGYVSLGRSQAWTQAQNDDTFFAGRDGHANHYLNAVDRVQGGEAYVGYRWTDYAVQPFLTAGIAQFWHAVTQTHDTWSEGGTVRAPDITLHGTYRAWRVGGGLCYGWVCGEVTYYKGATPGSNFPISTDAVVPMLSLRVPLNF